MSSQADLVMICEERELVVEEKFLAARVWSHYRLLNIKRVVIVALLPRALYFAVHFADALVRESLKHRENPDDSFSAEIILRPLSLGMATAANFGGEALNGAQIAIRHDALGNLKDEHILIVDCLAEPSVLAAAAQHISIQEPASIFAACLLDGRQSDTEISPLATWLTRFSRLENDAQLVGRGMGFDLYGFRFGLWAIKKQ